MRTKKLTVISVLIASGLALGWIEAKIPAFGAIPGGKIGLANITSLLSLYLFGLPTAFTVALLRCGILSLISGAPISFIYSGTGAVLIVLTMFFAKNILNNKVSAAGVSILGAVSFNFGQTLVAAMVLGNINVLRYLPVLCFISACSGGATGLAANGILGAIKNV